MGNIYMAGVVITAILLIVENALVRAGNYKHITLAFFTINGVISLLLAGAAVTDMVLA